LPTPRPLLRAITTLPFVISTEAQRSGEICGLAVPSWKCFSTERSVVVEGLLGRSLISRGQHRLKKGRLGLFMHHGGVHILKSGFAQQQLQFHFTEA
jgi:hypothetical protein